MKKVTIILLFGFLLGCSKEEDSSSSSGGGGSSSNNTPTVAGVQLPSADAGLYTIISELDGSKNLQNSAWFESHTSSTDVGKVSYEIDDETEDLTFFLGRYTSSNFLPDNFDETIWTVEGKNGFPGLTVTDSKSMPIVNDFSCTATEITESASSVTVTNLPTTSADLIVYGLVDLSNQTNNKYFVASSVSSNSHTFTNSDFTPFIQFNNGIKGIPFTITALKYSTEDVQGKKVLLVKQFTSWTSVNVE